MEAEAVITSWWTFPAQAAATYVLIGLVISMLGGCWKPTTATRGLDVKIVQIAVLTFLWLPVMMIELVRGHGTTEPRDDKKHH